ncbi:hypothetical protein PLANPX_3200 [Lacipirellula parvula]|uniref:Uncharacterized protein n=1 Tax=Lacipirellula parvula TaxID=2650471 RepID=A0A5K7XAM2_9BACT|nr:hypothetical protein PLANPX_3200 [Lacipirellula parvula]
MLSSALCCWLLFLQAANEPVGYYAVLAPPTGGSPVVIGEWHSANGFAASRGVSAVRGHTSTVVEEAAES